MSDVVAHLRKQAHEHRIVASDHEKQGREAGTRAQQHFAAAQELIRLADEWIEAANKLEGLDPKRIAEAVAESMRGAVPEVADLYAGRRGSSLGDRPDTAAERRRSALRTARTRKRRLKAEAKKWQIPKAKARRR